MNRSGRRTWIGRGPDHESIRCSDRVAITGNQLLKIRFRSIWCEHLEVSGTLHGAENITVTGNAFEQASEFASEHLMAFGGKVDAFLDGLVVSGNRLVNSFLSAIMVGAYVRNFSITGNVISGAYRGGNGLGYEAAIWIGSTTGVPVTDGTIVGNTIHGDPSSLGVGVFLNGSGVQRVVVASNHVDGASAFDVRNTSGTATPSRVEALALGGGMNPDVVLTSSATFGPNGSGVGTIRHKGSTSRDSAGFLKLEIEGTDYFVPLFETVSN